VAEDVRTGPHDLSRQQISSAVDGLGWRFVLGAVRTRVRVDSMAQAVEVAGCAVEACGDQVTDLAVDLRSGVVLLQLQSHLQASVTPAEIEVARRISAAIEGLGLMTDADAAKRPARSVQALEIAIDAIDIAAVRPFWKAVLGYRDGTDADGPEDAVVDPDDQGPPLWFQQMTSPRAQRNRIHIDISVPHEQAPHRLSAALEAGGELRSAAHAPAFWVLADPEGNEACLSTWQGRDD
jgi:4a-hydroxytetrahydrobiopterin dehydratase